MPHLPTRTVTFLFTDIEGSTRLLQQLGDNVSEQVFADHRRLLREAVESVRGHVYQDHGESFLFVFQRAKDAILGAIAGQRALAAHVWPDDTMLRVRMALHSGEPAASGDEYVGLDVHRAARICSAGHGRQILLSLTTWELKFVCSVMSKWAETLVIPLVEEPGGFENLPEICQVHGVDIIAFGPGDLAMGHPGNSGHPEVQKIIRRAEQQVVKSGKALDAIVADAEEATRALARGARFISIGVQTMLRESGRAFLKSVKA